MQPLIVGMLDTLERLNAQVTSGIGMRRVWRKEGCRSWSPTASRRNERRKEKMTRRMSPTRRMTVMTKNMVGLLQPPHLLCVRSSGAYHYMLLPDEDEEEDSAEAHGQNTEGDTQEYLDYVNAQSAVGTESCRVVSSHEPACAYKTAFVLPWQQLSGERAILTELEFAGMDVSWFEETGEEIEMQSRFDEVDQIIYCSDVMKDAMQAFGQVRRSRSELLPPCCISLSISGPVLWAHHILSSGWESRQQAADAIRSCEGQADAPATATATANMSFSTTQELALPDSVQPFVPSCAVGLSPVCLGFAPGTALLQLLRRASFQPSKLCILRSSTAGFSNNRCFGILAKEVEPKVAADHKAQDP
eukprot:scaffold1130_cov195-Pinguiococcus_pyrenoidosus.AAC.44